ncbi:MAG: alpha/beta hydrolase [Pseudomonadota bacterium]
MDGPAGPLEVRIDVPRGLDLGIDLVICHPHPLHGGTFDNKVVHTLARAARDIGLRAVRFNFRGVGGSAGTHDGGRGEVDDLLAIVEGCAHTAPGRALVLAGFSFGAWVAAAGAVRLQAAGRAPRALLLVAPPVQYPGFASLPPFALPLLVIQGDDDEVVDPRAVADWCGAGQPRAQLLRLPAGHFFHGSLPALKDETARWLRDILSPRPFPPQRVPGKLPSQ